VSKLKEAQGRVVNKFDYDIASCIFMCCLLLNKLKVA
jgi:hypothetical protein